MQCVSKRKPMSRRIVPHDEFIERVRKTLYFGNDSLTADLEISRPLAEYSAELFSDAHRGHSLNRLNSISAGSVHATPCSLLLALIYLDRLNTADPTYLRRITPQELFIVSMMISTKFHKGHDEVICIADWAKDGNISEKRLKRLELDFLSVIDWNVYVSNQEFFEKLEHVELQLALREGLKRGWLTYTELAQMLPSFTFAKFLLNHLTLITLTYTASLVTLTSALLMVNHLTTITTPATLLNQNTPVTTARVTPTDVSNRSSINAIETDKLCAQITLDDAELEIKSYLLHMAEICLKDKTIDRDALATNWKRDFFLELYKQVYDLDGATLLNKSKNVNETEKDIQAEAAHHNDKPISDKLTNDTLKNCLAYQMILEMVKMFFGRISIF